MQSGQQTGDNN